MKVYGGAAWPVALRRRASVVTIGNFDGLHLGHQSLLAQARALPGHKVVLTFDPHPSSALYPERGHRRLMPRADLAERLPAFAIDDLWIVPFTRAFAALGAHDFLDAYVGRPFDAREIVAGHDFAFGRDRGGSLDLLRQWASARGARVHVLPPLEVDGKLVSSRSLRALVEAGDLEGARRLLGRPWYLRGPIVGGDRRGRELGFPTLNQEPENETLPPAGVYAARALINGLYLPCVTNVGVGPTFGGAKRKFESHVLDGSVAAPAGAIDVELWARLRDERKFDGASDLKEQIARDVRAAREALG